MTWKLSASSRSRVVLTVLAHSLCSIWSILQNKTALNSLDAPILLLVIQTFVQVVLLTAIGLPMRWIKVHKSLSLWTPLFPLVLSKSLSTILKTYTLASVHASFYQLSRGLLLPFTLLLSALFLRPRPTFPPFVLVGCSSVTLGFGAGAITDLSAALTKPAGLVLGALGSLATAADTVIVKHFFLRKGAVKDVQPEKEQDGGLEEEGQALLQLAWQSAVLSLGLYLPILALTGQHTGNLRSSAVDAIEEVATQYQFYHKAIVSGLASTLLNLVTLLQINITSPTTHMVVSAARGVAQSLLAVVVLGEVATGGRVLGMALVLGGSALYGWGRDKEARDREMIGDSVEKGPLL